MTKEEVIIIINDFKDRCLEQIIKEANPNPHRIVAIIREHNREWNKLAETNPVFKTDGFSKLMKKFLLENGKKMLESIPGLESSLQYL